MNATLPPQNQIEAARDSGGYAFIGIHCGNHLNEMLKPPGQMDCIVPFGLFVRVIQLVLFLGDREIGGVGTLLDGIVVSQSKTPLDDVETIKKELIRMGIDAFYQVGIYTASGWVCFSPGPHIRMAHLMDSERFEFKAQQLLNLVKGFSKSQTLPPPDDGAKGGGEPLT